MLYLLIVQGSARDGDTEYIRLSQLVKSNIFEVDKRGKPATHAVDTSVLCAPALSMSAVPHMFDSWTARQIC